MLDSAPRLLDRAFNIRPHEWSRLLFIYLIYFVFLTSTFWGLAIVQGAFLELIGVQYLPYVLVANAVFIVLGTAFYTAFADRVNNTTLLVAIFIVSAIGVLFGLLSMGWGVAFIAFPLLYMVADVPLSGIFNVHWPIYVNGFYNTQSAKRIIPFLSSGARLAGIVSGLTMSTLNRWLSPQGIIVIWLAGLLVAAVLAWLMPHILKPAEAEGTTTTPTVESATLQKTAYVDNVREGFRYVAESPFLRWMAVSSLLVYIIFALLQYQSDLIFQNQLQTTANISNFVAMLNSVSNLIVLPLQLFFMSRLIARVGIGNTSLIFPSGTWFICGALVISPNVFTGALAYINRRAFRTAFLNPLDNLFYNAIPLRIKGRARAFVMGLVVPVGTIIGGLLLLLPWVTTTWLLSALIVILSTAYFINALVIRKKYPQAVIDMLEQEDFSFLFSQQDSSLVTVDPGTLVLLRKRLDESASPEFSVFMFQLISRVGGKEATDILVQTVNNTQASQTRLAMIDVLVASDSRGPAVRNLYVELLADPDGQVRQAAIAGLEQSAGMSDKQFAAQMLVLLDDPDIDVRVRALQAVLSRVDFYQVEPAVRALEHLLAADSEQLRARGVKVLGQLGDERALRRLLTYLRDPGDAVRLEAAVAIETLAGTTKMPDQVNNLILDQVYSLLQDPVERVRQAMVMVLGHIGNQESNEAMLQLLVDPSTQVRETTVNTLAHIGKSIIPVVHPLLNSSDPQRRKMAAVVLSRVDPREFGALISTSIMANLLVIYRNLNLIEAFVPCAGYPSLTVLQSVFREQNDQLMAEIFYLLAAIHPPDDVKLVSESLRSERKRTRENAAEALEALTTPQVARLIVPLFDPELSPEQILVYSRDAWDMETQDAATVLKRLVVDPANPWLRALVTFSLGEMGAKQSPPASNDESEIRRRRSRAKLSSLFDALGGGTDETVLVPEEKAAEETAPPPVAPPPAGQVFTLPEIETMIKASLADPEDEVRAAAQAAQRVLAGRQLAKQKEAYVLSTIEKMIFLKGAPFFQGMTIDQLRVLANVCEEEFFAEDTRIFNEGDPGGALFVVVSGRVGIEQEKRKGSTARLATIEAHSYFGEMSLFDNSARSASAVALQDTWTLRLRREPLIALARQYPDLSLELISVLSQRLREANFQIAKLTRSRPRELHKLFDQLD